MASKREKTSATLNRDEWDERLRKAGHTMAWRLAPNSHRAGWAYQWIGDCTDCGANIIVDWCSTTCQSVRDARHVDCSGPGTAVLTEIEDARFAEHIADAVSEFGAAMKRRR